MSNPRNPLRSLLHPLGLTGPARARAFRGTGASKIALGTTASKINLLLFTLTATLGMTLLFSVVQPGYVQASAPVGPTPIAGSPGLPDGRVYEQASPPDKNGNAAGGPVAGNPPAMIAEPGGDGVAYSDNNGSIGHSESGAQFVTVAKRGSEGWVNNGAFPRAMGASALLDLIPVELGFSADLTKVYFSSADFYLPQAPPHIALRYDILGGSLTWLDPPPATTEAGQGEVAAMAGFSTDMSTFYFRTETGFYEFHDGVLSVAGVLPDGSVDPGAIAAGLPRNPRAEPFQGSTLRNQVSEDGADAFFVAGGICHSSQQRGACESYSGTPQLYVRETAPDGSQTTALVSRDPLLPNVGGLPAPALHGVRPITFPLVVQSAGQEEQTSSGYVYASPDGSHAFFASEDRLTSAAPGGGGMYEFDTATGSLTYLPGVGASPILASSHDGSRFIFNGPGGMSLWSEGPEGGTVKPVEPFPVRGEARATPSGSVFVFESAAPIPGFNNGGTHLGSYNGGGPFPNQEIYRYDVVEGSLSCVSCPPKGIVPSGDAYMSHDTAPVDAAGGPSVFFSNRGVSEDGSRVFFDSPDPLVPQVTNTRPLELNPHPNVTPLYLEHGRNVYEWENGRIFLISTGTSDENSYVGDVSANGNDVFFSTSQGLAPGDLDEAYDVYDARVPRPGDNPPAAPAGCEGDVCQGPPSVPNLLGAPASATFNGLGNPPRTVAAPTVVKPTPKAKGCKKGFTKKNGKCVKNRKSKRAKKPIRNRRPSR